MSTYGSKSRSELETVQARLARLEHQSEVIRRNQSTISAIFEWFHYIEKMALAEDPKQKEYCGFAHEAFEEMSNDDQIALYRAPSSGGIWETWQREVLKTGELGPAWNAYVRRSG